VVREGGQHLRWNAGVEVGRVFDDNLDRPAVGSVLR
jgi:hypothetical protein